MILMPKAQPTVFLLLLALISVAMTPVSAGESRDEPVYPARNLEQDDYRASVGWDLVWSDEFLGDRVDPGNWTRQVEAAGRFNGEWQRYTDQPENAYIENGCLVIRAIHTSDVHGPDQYTSARLHTAGKHAWAHGKVVARMQLPYGAGTWPAFWMLGANIDENGGDTPWPQSGEIDIMEFYGSKDNGAVEANIHYAGADDQHRHMGAERFELKEGRFADAFHVFEMEWDAEMIRWSVDGREYARHPISDPVYSELHQPHFILFNLAIGGEWSGRPDESTRFPQTFYIDWVRVYQKDIDPSPGR
jgi:beta-glucanase (GH16 family)